MRSVPPGWQVAEREPGRVLRLHANRPGPGDRWLEMRVSPEGSGSRYEQRAIFYPRGLPGRLYWHAVKPVRGIALKRRVRRVTSGG